MNVITIRGEFEQSQGYHFEYDRDGIPLGQGGMGRIFQGFKINDATGQCVPVAIKEINENIAGNPELIERAMREASIQIDHDNLLRMYGFVPNIEYGAASNTMITRYYMVMERLVGANLDQVLSGNVFDKSGMSIPLAQHLYQEYVSDKPMAILEIMRGVLSGIQALHDHGYIHRDIDPSNVMVTLDNKIKMIDFGVCKQVNSWVSQSGMPQHHLTQAGSFIGKFNYAAPESVSGDIDKQNFTTDIYSLGVMLFQLATGHLPFTGTNQELMSAHLLRPLPVKEIDNKYIRRVVEKSTQKKQELRYASAREMLADLEHIANPTSSGTVVKEHSEPVPPCIPAWAYAIAAPVGLVMGVVLNFIL